MITDRNCTFDAQKIPFSERLTIGINVFEPWKRADDELSPRLKHDCVRRYRRADGRILED